MLVTLPIVLPAQGPSSGLRLSGMIKVEGMKLAVLEVPRPLSQPAREIIMGEGQREDRTELIAVYPENGTAKIHVSGESGSRLIGLKNQNRPEGGTSIGLALEDVSLHSVLQLLGSVSGRTVLQHPSLPTMKFTLANAVTNRAEAAQILMAALAEKQILVVPDGEKFWLVAPKAHASALNPRSTQSLAMSTNSAEAQLLPAGSINYQGAPVISVLMVYIEFRGDKLDRNFPLPALKGDFGHDGIFLTMKTELTKAECLYAMETLIDWQGIKIVPAGNGLVKAVSILPEKMNHPAK